MDRKTQKQILWATIVSFLLLLLLALNPVQAEENKTISESFQIFLPLVAAQDNFEPTRWDNPYDCSTNPLQKCGHPSSWNSCGTEFCGQAVNLEVNNNNCIAGTIDPTNSRIREVRNGSWISFADYGIVGQTIIQEQHLYSWGATIDFTYQFASFQRPGKRFGLERDEIHFVWNCQPTS